MSNDDIPKLLDEVEIDIDKVKHFVFTDGAEMICEIASFDKKSNEYSIKNTVKILRESWVTEEGYETQNIYVDWNPCIDFTQISTLNKSLILTDSIPNKPALDNYIRTAHNFIFPVTINASELGSILDDMLDTSEEKEQSNIIQFSKYIRK